MKRGCIRDKDSIRPTGLKNKGRPQTEAHRAAIREAMLRRAAEDPGSVLLGTEMSTGFARLFASAAAAARFLGVSKAMVARAAKPGSGSYSTRGWEFKWVPVADLCLKDGLDLWQSAAAGVARLNDTMERGLRKIKAARRRAK